MLSFPHHFSKLYVKQKIHITIKPTLKTPLNLFSPYLHKYITLLKKSYQTPSISPPPIPFLLSTFSNLTHIIIPLLHNAFTRSLALTVIALILEKLMTSIADNINTDMILQTTQALPSPYICLLYTSPSP